MDVNEGQRPYLPGELPPEELPKELLEQRLRIAPGGRCRIRKGQMPWGCALAADGAGARGAVLWIPRAGRLPILEVPVPPAGAVPIAGQAGVLVNDTGAPLVVRWRARL